MPSVTVNVEATGISQEANINRIAVSVVVYPSQRSNVKHNFLNNGNSKF